MEEHLKCKICGETFSSLKGVHSHVSKIHKTYQSDYYNEYYPRFDKFNGLALPYRNYADYWKRDFFHKSNMYSWLKKADKKEAAEWALKKLKSRIEEKGIKFSPCNNDLISSDAEVPSIVVYEYFFGSYEKALKLIGAPEPLFKPVKSVPDIKMPDDLTILIDTREQQPLEFKNSRSQKLAFGDYTLDSENYTYTYVDRKSEGDFKSTMSQGFDRFCREVERVVNFDSYLYVVVESSIDLIERNNGRSSFKAKLPWIFNNMRELHNLFPRKIQFVFTGSRKNSVNIIPYLLYYGEELWNVDVQYLLQSKGVR